MELYKNIKVYKQIWNHLTAEMLMAKEGEVGGDLNNFYLSEILVLQDPVEWCLKS